MELLKLWEIICRRKWIFIQSFLIFSLIAIIGAFSLPSVYETSVKVFIEDPVATSAILSSIDLATSATQESDQNTKNRMELITVTPVLKKVISKLQLRDRNDKLMKPDDLIKWKFIVSDIFPEPYVEIEEVEDSDLIEIKARSSDVQEAIMLANTVAEAYIEEDIRKLKDEYGNARAYIEKKIKESKAKFLKALDECRKFKVEEKTVDLEDETKNAIDKMAGLIKEKEDNIINISVTKSKIKTLKDQLSRESETAVSSSAVTENPIIESLRKTLNDINLELAAALTEKKPTHPDVVAALKKKEKARSELKKEIEIFQNMSKDLQSLEIGLVSLETQLKGINENLNKSMDELYSIPNKVFTNTQLNIQLSTSKDIYNSLLEFLCKVNIAEAMSISNIHIVEFPIEPDIDKPDRPNKPLIIIIGIFLGSIFGFCFVFLQEFVDDSIINPDEIKAAELTLLGTIPKLRSRNDSLITRKDPKDPVTEAYRTVRNRLKFAVPEKTINSLLIISSTAREGRTTTIANLGISFAREGRKVLLIDTDLRSPGVHEIFEVSNTIGVTTILEEDRKPGDAIKMTDIEGLNLLTSGPAPSDPARLIESVKMKQLISDLATKYDLIILDSSPILEVCDALILAGYVDNSIIILESGKTDRKTLSQARELLEQANLQPCGAILNKYKG